MPFKSSRLRLILRILLALLLTLSAMSAGVFWLLQRNPQALADLLVAEAAERQRREAAEDEGHAPVAGVFPSACGC